MDTDQKTIVLGQEKIISEKFLYSRKKIVTHTLDQDNFPLTIFGSQSSGRNATLRSLVAQYIKNNQGFIYSDNTDPLFSCQKFNNLIKKYNNKKNVFVLNFSDKNIDFTSHCIDPINPLIGDEQAFKLLFGDSLGVVIHDIAQAAKSKKMLVDADMLEELLQLENLRKYLDNDDWKSSHETITQYLSKCEQGIHDCALARASIDNLKKYTAAGAFGTVPDISVEDLLVNQDILYCVLPSWHYIYDKDNVPKPMDFILLQIKYVTKLVSETYPNIKHWQNIAMVDCEYTCSYPVYQYLVNDLSRKNTWLFSIYIPQKESENYRPDLEKNKSLLIKASETIVMMQTASYPLDLSDSLKLTVLERVQDLENIFYAYDLRLRDQRSGYGYVMIKKQKQYKLLKLSLYYEDLL